MNRTTKPPDPGAIVVVDFPGVTGIKRRPAVIVSSALYHRARPDVILGVITTQIDSARAATDYLLQDWKAAGLRRTSAFRTFLVTLPRSAITARLGQLSETDWQAVRERVKVALA
jgi:mRNA interferase MazF